MSKLNCLRENTAHKFSNFNAQFSYVSIHFIVFFPSSYWISFEKLRNLLFSMSNFVRSNHFKSKVFITDVYSSHELLFVPLNCLIFKFEYLSVNFLIWNEKHFLWVFQHQTFLQFEFLNHSISARKSHTRDSCCSHRNCHKWKYLQTFFLLIFLARRVCFV